MQNPFAFPSGNHANVQIFYCLGSSWQTWQRPSGVSMLLLLAVGGGGGGTGSDEPSSIHSLCSGGGGGGIARLLIGAHLLPDCLFVQAGLGGAGGIGNDVGGNPAEGADGARSFVSVQPGSTAAANLVLVSGTTAAQGGRNAGTGSAGETIATAAGAVFSNGGAWVAVAGGAGANSDAGAVAALGACITCGGAAGRQAFGNNPGGAITGAGLIPTIPGGTGTAAADGGNGGAGFARFFPMLFCGGSGGGSGVDVGHHGGNGGDGAYGCGGGGAGASHDGTSGTTHGGAGGNGFVIIASW